MKRTRFPAHLPLLFQAPVVCLTNGECVQSAIFPDLACTGLIIDDAIDLVWLLVYF